MHHACNHLTDIIHALVHHEWQRTLPPHRQALIVGQAGLLDVHIQISHSIDDAHCLVHLPACIHHHRVGDNSINLRVYIIYCRSLKIPVFASQSKGMCRLASPFRLSSSVFRSSMSLTARMRSMSSRTAPPTFSWNILHYHYQHTQRSKRPRQWLALNHSAITCIPDLYTSLHSVPCSLRSPERWHDTV